MICDVQLGHHCFLLRPDNLCSCPSVPPSWLNMEDDSDEPSPVCTPSLEPLTSPVSTPRGAGSEEDDVLVSVTMVMMTSGTPCSDMMISGTPCSEPPMILSSEGSSEEDAPVVNVTLDMMSSKRLYCDDHYTNDCGLSIGRFICIAKNALDVTEGSISLVIGTTRFNRDRARDRIMTLPESVEYIRTHGCLNIIVVRTAEPEPTLTTRPTTRSLPLVCYYSARRALDAQLQHCAQ